MEYEESTDSAPGSHLDSRHGANRPLAVIAATGIGIFLSAADSTIVIASYGRIGNDLDALGEANWVALGYYLTLSTFQPLYGRLSDIFGVRRCLLFAYATFGLGSLLCGLSGSIWQLFAARLCQGIGGGGMTTLVSILLTDIVPLEDRGLWQGLLNIVYAAGAGAGGPIGGAFAESTWGWRVSFFVQIPFSILAFVAVSLVLPSSAGYARTSAFPTTVEPHEFRESIDLHQPHNSPTSPLTRIDFPGAFSLFAAILSLLVALDRGSNVGWASPFCWAPLVAFPLFAAIFLHIETAVAVEPFTPPAWVARRSRLPAYLSSLFAFGANVAHAYSLAMIYQVTRDASPLQASLLLLPGTIAEVIGTLLSGFLLKRSFNLYRLNIFGYAMVALGNVSIANGARSSTRLAVLLFGNAMAGLGNGFGIITSLVNPVASAKKEEQAIAVSSCYLFRVIGSITGISITSALTRKSLGAILQSTLDADDVSYILSQTRHSLDFLSDLDPTLAAIVATASRK
ncbi:major facilitator superfamily transporter multidrug resistance [Grosmannia clavigera kw1407]|uniref:Major facilitator superfamily transporter multidrug resistance n=1 Tax=Grosmannia clavigera (strain kw1407 / UAMH 11150) TaxID=655863 RepID=F0XAW5_GROCL|nr:major facilitator superfamily transporter multidrug resistance [Grosmannia clavigera kw1407]EFX05169.1 major facilitator superfamily transporter multidrug resistance [Grosmannia clavigera kw1407]